MAKKLRAVIKLQLEAGKATPAPPVGPALGQHGANIMAFCKEYNERTASQAGSIIPVEIIVYDVGGRKIRRLVSGVRTEGEHRVTWDGIDDNGKIVASGVYFYRLHFGGRLVETKKMMLLK